MASGWRYRIASVLGVTGLVVFALVVANYPLVGSAFQYLPIVGDLPLNPPGGIEFVAEATTTAVVVLAALAPLYKPRPRRILDIWMIASKRTFVSMLALATIGYFDFTFRLPRATLLVTGTILLAAVPIWFVTIRSRPENGDSGRMIIIGDDPREIDRILESADVPVLGYVSPTPYVIHGYGTNDALKVTDGSGGIAETFTASENIECLGGLSRLSDILVEYDVDTAIFAFNEADREEFFGVLATCHEHGVEAKIHREQADSLLTDGDPAAELVDIDVEPWDWQDRAIKRVFDIGFAGAGLLLALPVLVVIAVAIKLDSEGSLFYTQERTAEFGETFTVYKFRSMVPSSEDVQPGEDENQITRVGWVLRRTHLDELPQLWSILVGDMSVVGPRAVWTDEEHLLEDDVSAWRQRWFVRPGLTGLAQINGASSEEPQKKLRYDVEYIQRQSLSFDTKIVFRQIWIVLGDIVRTVSNREK